MEQVVKKLCVENLENVCLFLFEYPDVAQHVALVMDSQSRNSLRKSHSFFNNLCGESFWRAKTERDFGVETKPVKDMSWQCLYGALSNILPGCVYIHFTDGWMKGNDFPMELFRNSDGLVEFDISHYGAALNEKLGQVTSQIMKYGLIFFGSARNKGRPHPIAIPSRSLQLIDNVLDDGDFITTQMTLFDQDVQVKIALSIPENRRPARLRLVMHHGASLDSMNIELF